MHKKNTFVLSSVDALVMVTLWHRHTQTTHSEAELGDVQVEPGRVEVDEAEQCSKYP